MTPKPNTYSRQWFEFFHIGIDEGRTIRETEFVCSCAPRPEFQKILDLCCGMGRHARALANRGYAVTAIDHDRGAIAKARELGGGPNCVVADIRQYQPERGAFHAAIVMGQSFGHFDDATNRDILSHLAASIGKRGRVILDLWNPEFFAAHQGARDLETPRGVVRETKRVEQGRLVVQLDYPDGVNEKFEWQLFTSEEMKQFANAAGLSLLISCSGFDAKNPFSSGDPRIQFVLQRESDA